MARLFYGYEVRFDDRPPIQAAVIFDPVSNPGRFTSLGAYLRDKFPDYSGVTIQQVPDGVGISFPITFPIK